VYGGPGNTPVVGVVHHLWLWLYGGDQTGTLHWLMMGLIHHAYRSYTAGKVRRCSVCMLLYTCYI